MKDRIYAVVHGTRKEAYIGRTYSTLQERWSEHLQAAARGEMKRFYESYRFEPHAWEVLECEYSETASEADWMARFKADGYTLLNQVGGNRKPPKCRDTAKERADRSALEGEPRYEGPLYTQAEWDAKCWAEVNAATSVGWR